jgi:polyphenol oxidase
MHTWNWQTTQDLPYLTCTLLQDFPHGFFTRHFWGQSPADITTVLNPSAQAYRLKQVHGDRVFTPSEITTEMAQNPVAEATADSAIPDTAGNNSDFPHGDGVITERSHQAVWACSADCTPVLIADVGTGQVAAVHAGWRGTAAQIVPKAIARLQAQGSKLADLRVAMGPAIVGEVYQVKDEVAVIVGRSVTDGGEELLQQLKALDRPPILPDEVVGHVRLDVRRINAMQLEQLGLAEEQVAIAPFCTFQMSEHFFSYRREAQKKVQWSGIVSL